MFDRAPKLFGARNNFSRIGNQAIDITAIGIIQLLDIIQVSQRMPIKDNIIFTPHLRNFINAKVNTLPRVKATDVELEYNFTSM